MPPFLRSGKLRATIRLSRPPPLDANTFCEGSPFPGKRRQKVLLFSSPTFPPSASESANPIQISPKVRFISLTISIRFRYSLITFLLCYNIISATSLPDRLRDRAGKFWSVKFPREVLKGSAPSFLRRTTVPIPKNQRKMACSTEVFDGKKMDFITDGNIVWMTGFVTESEKKGKDKKGQDGFKNGSD